MWGDQTKETFFVNQGHLVWCRELKLFCHCLKTNSFLTFDFNVFLSFIFFLVCRSSTLAKGPLLRVCKCVFIICRSTLKPSFMLSVFQIIVGRIERMAGVWGHHKECQGSQEPTIHLLIKYICKLKAFLYWKIVCVNIYPPPAEGGGRGRTVTNGWGW